MTIREFRQLLRGTDPEAELLFRYNSLLLVVGNIITQNADAGGGDVKKAVVVPLDFSRTAVAPEVSDER